MRCNQCEALMIQGVFCHETGCPNTHSRYDAEDDRWIKQRECFECGCMVDEDESCCGKEEDYLDIQEDTDSLEDHGMTLGSYQS
jgi:hypothetical protein